MYIRSLRFLFYIPCQSGLGQMSDEFVRLVPDFAPVAPQCTVRCRRPVCRLRIFLTSPACIMSDGRALGLRRHEVFYI